MVVIIVHTKLLAGWVEVPLNLLSEKESVDLLLSMGKVEVVSDGTLAAAKRIAKAANYLRTCQISKEPCILFSLSCSSFVFIHPWWSCRPGKKYKK